MALAAAAASASIAPFSRAAPGAELPPGWRLVTLPRIAPAEIALVPDAGTTVLRIRASAAAASAAYRLSDDAGASPILGWRWKVDRVVRGADLARREGDDYAARVYVTFDVPVESLGFAERARIALARVVHGAELPTAALCYVWDNTHPVGTSAWNAYSSRVRMVVAESGEARAGEWVEVRRDVAEDFVRAFGAQWRGRVPRITGVALSADTDQTGETVQAWFGDVAFGARP